MIVLIHTSKTMRSQAPGSKPKGTPALLERAEELMTYLRTLSPQQIARVMAVSGPLATKTYEQIDTWSTAPTEQWPAVESFLGDIYSGLQVSAFTAPDRTYANRRLRILSGLYGILKPFDGISPYRLEMGYRLPDSRYSNLYRFWGSSVAAQLPKTGPIVNLAANEYSKVVLDHVDAKRVVTPRFLTADPRSGEPRFVAVHAKIARGALARWLITNQADSADGIGTFADLGYELDQKLSAPREPCFVCADFEGKGMSVRLQ